MIGVMPERDAEGNFLQNVSTQLERDDKDLKCVCGFAVTDTNGVARIAMKIPDGGRWIAYGDGEFSTRDFGDYISKLAIEDLDRLIAWGVALAIDPDATAPVSDATIQAMTAEQLGGIGPYPAYPYLDGYLDTEVDVNATNKAGTLLHGISMSFKAENTKVEPVAGYGWIPEKMYLVLEAKNALTQKAQGINLAVSLDMAKSKPEGS